MQLFEEANLRDSAVGEQRQMKEEIHSEKAALTIAKQELQAVSFGKIVFKLIQPIMFLRKSAFTIINS